MKSCYQCQKNKPEEEFYSDTHSEDGLTSSCKDCQKQRAKERYKKGLTDKQKAARREAYLKWKSANPEKFKEHTEKSNLKRVSGSI